MGRVEVKNRLTRWWWVVGKNFMYGKKRQEVVNRVGTGGEDEGRGFPFSLPRGQVQYYQELTQTMSIDFSPLFYVNPDTLCVVNNTTICPLIITSIMCNEDLVQRYWYDWYDRQA